jgi:hypothetical protein
LASSPASARAAAAGQARLWLWQRAGKNDYMTSPQNIKSIVATLGPLVATVKDQYPANHMEETWNSGMLAGDLIGFLNIRWARGLAGAPARCAQAGAGNAPPRQSPSLAEAHSIQES